MKLDAQKERLKLSLYLDNENLSVLEDLRYLTGLDGRGLRAVPDFTDVIDGLVYFFYYMLCIGAEDIKVKMLRKLIGNLDVKIFEDQNIEIISNIQDNNSYPPIVGYTAKLVVFKESQKKIIDKIVEIANKEIEIPENFDYSELIKRIISIVIKEQQLLLSFFDFLYFGNLYGLLPVTTIKLFLTESERLIPFEDSELKRVKFIRSDNSVISELYRIQNEIAKVPPKKQPDSLEKELFSSWSKLWSLVSDINYVDAFYGYILSKFYLVNQYKSLTSLITDISVNNILFETLSKLTSGKKSSLYLYYFATYRYMLNYLNSEAIRHFAADNREIDNLKRIAMILGSFNPFDQPSNLI
ncbi:MAG: hypothetical protein QXP38_09515 [Nitrososphaerota archaeon]